MQKKSQLDFESTFCATPLSKDFALDFIEFTPPEKEISRLHWHECYEIGYCHKGSGLFIIGNEIHNFKGGYWCLIPPRVSHLARSTDGDPSQWHFIYINPSQLFRTYPPLTHMLKGFEEELPMCVSLEDESSESMSLMIRSLVSLLNENAGKDSIIYVLGGIFSTAQNHNDVSRVPSPLLQSLSKCFDIISKRFRENIGIEFLAESSHMSLSTFRRNFKKATNETPHQFILNLRVKHSINLLMHTNRKVLDIAMDSGFEDISTFNRAFKKNTGKTPREFRKEERGGY